MQLRFLRKAGLWNLQEKQKRQRILQGRKLEIGDIQQARPMEDNPGKSNCLGVEGTVCFTVTQFIETKAGNREETQWAWEELFVNIFDFFLSCMEFYLV